MSERLVVVSNRVPPPPRDGDRWSPGGLVSALLPALEASGNALWFGWSGLPGDPARGHRQVTVRGVEYATFDLAASQILGYYGEFCNRLLWPLMHGLHSRVHQGAAAFYHTYREVNRYIARSLLPLLGAGDLVWVHDYHLIPLGYELRQLGWQGRVGYFHHTPVPVPEGWARVDRAGEFGVAMRAYDLVGVQTERDADRLEAMLGARRDRPWVAAYSASIDPDRFREFAARAVRPRLHEEGDDGEDRRMLFFGVDRLDYTKGIPQRITGFERALRQEPAMRDAARLVQWTAPSRTELPEYQAERHAVEAAAASLHARFGASPLVLSYEPHSPASVAAALREADVCLVTSVADGMNLVAKEFAAVHSEERPGVLVLSAACGAAEELTDALIFSMDDPDAMPRMLRRAFGMPVEERRRRSARLRRTVDAHTTLDWLDAFTDDLRSVRRGLPSMARERFASAS